MHKGFFGLEKGSDKKFQNFFNCSFLLFNIERRVASEYRSWLDQKLMQGRYQTETTWKCEFKKSILKK